MLLVLSAATAMIVWIVLFALGAKGFDGFLVALVVMLLAAVVNLLLPYLPGNRRAQDEPRDPAPFL
jgi:hypothetical protein